MFEYDESLEAPIAGWLQRLIGALLAAAVLGVTWVAAPGIMNALTGRLPFSSEAFALGGTLFLAWCGLVAGRLLSGDYGRRSLMPRWLFLAVGILFGVLTIVLLGLAFIAHVDVGADAVLTTSTLAVGCLYFGTRARHGG